MLKGKWGISELEYQRVLVAQDHKCAIYKTPRAELDRALAVDHDHETGSRRGLLCGYCNMVIGHLKDDPEIALAAYKYLMMWKERQR